MIRILKYFAVISLIAFAANIYSQSVSVNDKLSYGNDRWRPFFVDPIQVINTNTTSEVALTNVLVPAGVMGSNGVMRITFLGAAQTVNGNGKFFMFKMNGTLIRKVGLSSGTAGFLMYQQSWLNRNDPASQISFPSTQQPSYSGFGSAANTLSTTTINTAITNMFTITTSNQLVTDSISKEFLMIEFLRASGASN